MSPGVRRGGPGRTASDEVAPSNLNLAQGSTYTPTGLDRAITNGSSDWWYIQALLGVRQLAQAGRGFTLDNVRDLGIGEPPAPNYWGAMIATALRTGVIETVGCRVLRDGRLGRVFWGRRG